MVIKPGQPLTISCKVSYSVSSYYTSWIRQPAGKALEWIGHIDSGGGTAYKDSLKNKFTISRDTSSNTVSLHGSSLQTGDTAVYYCARDTQCSKATAGLYKNPPCLISLLNMHWAHVWRGREVLVGLIKQSSKVRPDSCILWVSVSNCVQPEERQPNQFMYKAVWPFWWKCCNFINES